MEDLSVLFLVSGHLEFSLQQFDLVCAVLLLPQSRNSLAFLSLETRLQLQHLLFQDFALI